MVDTFTCDSCGAPNIARPEKVKLLAKRQQELPNTDGTTNTATITQGMEVCPDCFMSGIVKNSIQVSENRKFTWRPNKSLDNTFFWNQRGGTKKKSKKEDDD